MKIVGATYGEILELDPSEDKLTLTFRLEEDATTNSVQLSREEAQEIYAYLGAFLEEIPLISRIIDLIKSNSHGMTGEEIGHTLDQISKERVKEVLTALMKGQYSFITYDVFTGKFNYE